MALRVLCCFSYHTGRSGWTDEHFCVTHFVRALKELPLRGYAYVPVERGMPRRRLDQTNASEAFEWFGLLAATKFADAALRGPLQLVPVPNSGCVVGAAASRTRRLAAALAARVQDVTVRDVLRFDHAVRSARSEHGLRDAADVFANLRVVESFEPGARVVLIDDTVASGGHLAAAKARVELAGGTVVAAVCAASAFRASRASPFEPVERLIPDFAPPSDIAVDSVSVDVCVRGIHWTAD